jgi:hypothetical protein
MLAFFKGNYKVDSMPKMKSRFPVTVWQGSDREDAAAPADEDARRCACFCCSVIS